MKLKKVTALLLATSMVLTSVNVAPIFADEEITFAEENYTVEDDASADVRGCRRQDHHKELLTALHRHKALAGSKSG